MNYGGVILDQMHALCMLFATHCAERETLLELTLLIRSPNEWSNAHDLFDKIRRKSLRATDGDNHTLEIQYRFEEICAKTIYNLSHSSAPFDPDSPYWVIPNALRLATTLQIPEEQVIRIIAAQQSD